jgi:hypothetical protein
MVLLTYGRRAIPAYRIYVVAIGGIIITVRNYRHHQGWTDRRPNTLFDSPIEYRRRPAARPTYHVPIRLKLSWNTYGSIDSAVRTAAAKTF